MAKQVFKRPKYLKQVISHYCPGCGHGKVAMLCRHGSGSQPVQLNSQFVHTRCRVAFPLHGLSPALPFESQKHRLQGQTA